MEEILHQGIGSLSHCLQGLRIPGGAGFLPCLSHCLQGLRIPGGAGFLPSTLPP